MVPDMTYLASILPFINAGLICVTIFMQWAQCWTLHARLDDVEDQIKALNEKVKP